VIFYIFVYMCWSANWVIIHINYCTTVLTVTNHVSLDVWDNKQTLALRQASEEFACFRLSFFCDD